jgi:hypothetical protein
VRSGLTTVRDELLGRALLELEPPGHRPDFYAQLHYRLAEERTFSLADARRRHRSRQLRLGWTLRVAAIAALAAVAVVVGLPRTATGPEQATAAEVKARIAGALTSAQTLSGELVFHGASYRAAYGWEKPKRWSFAMTAGGDLRIKEADGPSDLSYDADKGIERSLNASASTGGDAIFAAERRGVAPGPPDPGPSGSFLYRDFGSVVRALLAAKDPRVTETTYGGRNAWRLEIAVEPNAIVPELSGDRFVVTVDQETGFPLRIVEQKDGKLLDEIRLERLEVDSKLGPNAFKIAFPPGADVNRTDHGFRRVALARVETVVGYPPLVPASIPAGYELAEVAVAKEAPQTGVEGGNPVSKDVVSLAYRRGLDLFVVTTRLRRVPGFEADWSDPLGTGEGFRDEPENVTLAGGALAGVEAELLIVPRNMPHIWALTDDLVVTVAGDLSRQELIQVARSLRRQ